MPRTNAGKILQAAARNNSTLHDFLPGSTQSNFTPNQSNKKRKPGSPPDDFNMLDTTNPDLNSLSFGINAIMTQLTSVTETQKLHTDLMSRTAQQACKNEIDIRKMKTAQNSQLQWKLNDRIEISGMRKLAFTNKMAFRVLVWQFLKEIGLEIEKLEIADAYPRETTGKDGVKKYSVVIIFIHETIKQRIMIEKTKLRGDSVKGIYFNDVLTKHNRFLISKARELKNGKKFVKVGTVNGEIYVMKSLEGDKIFINDLMEMEELANISQINLVNEST
jgi:hypothetical protein